MHRDFISAWTCNFPFDRLVYLGVLYILFILPYLSLELAVVVLIWSFLYLLASSNIKISYTVCPFRTNENRYS